jgi:hypothetical protein
VIDAVRCAKLALDNGLKGALIAPSSYFKKSPPVQFPDDQARLMVEEFIQQYGSQEGPGRRTRHEERRACCEERPRRSSGRPERQPGEGFRAQVGREDPPQGEACDGEEAPKGRGALALFVAAIDHERPERASARAFCFELAAQQVG